MKLFVYLQKSGMLQDFLFYQTTYLKKDIKTDIGRYWLYL